MMTEVGSAYFEPEEAQRLREYLLKGGFLWADDFWGSYAWEHFEAELAKVLPPTEFRSRICRSIIRSSDRSSSIKRVPQIPSINHWARSGGGTSERGSDSAVPRARRIRRRRPPDGAHHAQHRYRRLVGARGDDPTYFYTFSVEGYAFGINVLLYAMAH